MEFALAFIVCSIMIDWQKDQSMSRPPSRTWGKRSSGTPVQGSVGGKGSVVGKGSVGGVWNHLPWRSGCSTGSSYLSRRFHGIGLHANYLRFKGKWIQCKTLQLGAALCGVIGEIGPFNYSRTIVEWSEIRVLPPTRASLRFIVSLVWDFAFLQKSQKRWEAGSSLSSVANLVHFRKCVDCSCHSRCEWMWMQLFPACCQLPGPVSRRQSQTGAVRNTGCRPQANELVQFLLNLTLLVSLTRYFVVVGQNIGSECSFTSFPMLLEWLRNAGPTFALSALL